MFKDLEQINKRPKPFEVYTADKLWTDPYLSKQMLSFHLNDKVDLSSRNSIFINKSVKWIISNFKVRKATKIADFGCGPGLYTNKLAKTGADVLGIDFSKRSINYAKDIARKNKLDVKYVHKDYLKYETKNKYDLIIMIFCDFSAMSPVQRGKMLKNSKSY